MKQLNTNDKRQQPAKAHGVSFHNEEKPLVRAFVLDIALSGPQQGGGRDSEARLEEITGLAEAIDLDIVEAKSVLLRSITAATYLGSGKVKALKSEIKSHKSELVITNAQLTPGQQRNLERAWRCKVLDRTGLILEIFGRRARTREGRLQVDLAHLAYQKSRLVRSWTHLERQRGGGGFMGGPGETQKESDRRDLQFRIKVLEGQLEKVKKTRGLHRKSRQKVPFPVVALVGYTNAGKSTLFNRLTTGGVLADDMLFATLDPTMRAVVLPHGRKIILSDTVGFISDLPTQLVAAFRATLEEVLSADLILHVRDIAHSDTELQRRDVYDVLKDLGIGEQEMDSIIEVNNKCDLLDDEERDRVNTLADRNDQQVAVSAFNGEGMDDLLAAVEHGLAKFDDILSLELRSEQGADIAWIYQNGEVLERTEAGDGQSVSLTARFGPSKIGIARARFAAASDRLAAQ